MITEIVPQSPSQKSKIQRFIHVMMYIIYDEELSYLTKLCLIKDYLQDYNNLLYHNYISLLFSPNEQEKIYFFIQSLQNYYNTDKIEHQLRLKD
jgi:hypothetical protein